MEIIAIYTVENTSSWEGLTVFVANPLVPMHNNLAERVLRPLALARKNFYGSRAPWSGHLAAMCLSICKTAEIYDLNPQAYLLYYFNMFARIISGEEIELTSLLPWNLSPDVINTHNLRKTSSRAG